MCSAHIHWDPEFCDVKLIQTMMLMERLREITETFGHDFRPDRHKKGSDNVHLLLCAGNAILGRTNFSLPRYFKLFSIL